MRGDSLYHFQIKSHYSNYGRTHGFVLPIDEPTVTFKALNETPNFSLSQAEEFGSFI